MPRRLFGAGSNAAGQLGTHTLDDAHVFVSSSVAGPCNSPSATAAIVQAAAGANHSLVLDAAGTVLVCGSNEHGQLGSLGSLGLPSDTHAATTGSMKPHSAVFVPAHIPGTEPGDDPIVSVACGWDSSFAISSRG
ncbi:regulator of chromosome condensation 1/beta-lactamase-inhibitor protein II [Entophlyctis helioformis]|nr:regulator of chromosome condensation 1/beta-lactamase-inhibitor protein II [Entophlyctis helioformis]